jgi:hypothetical protein
MSFRITDLMVDVTPSLFAAGHGCPNSGHPTHPGRGQEKGCPNSGPPPEEDGCPNSGPPPEPDGGCPNSGHAGRDVEDGCPNSGITGKGRSPRSAAGLPDLRRQLRETLGAHA